jgi:hypothetical protein
MEFEVDQTTDSGIVITRVGLVGLAGDFGFMTLVLPSCILWIPK